jgi:hypothetical protein
MPCGSLHYSRLTPYWSRTFIPLHSGKRQTDARRVGSCRCSTRLLYDPAIEIPIAAQLVRQNLQGASGILNVAIAAYNEGLSRALADFLAGAPWRTTDPAYTAKARDAMTLYTPYFEGQVRL